MNTVGGQSNRSTVERVRISQPKAGHKSLGARLLDFLEHPLTLTALFALGGLVGTLIYTPFYILCALCMLLGFHRAKVISEQPRRLQTVVYSGLSIALAVGGYFLYGSLDAAVDRIQTNFAKKVASLVKKEAPKTSDEVTAAVATPASPAPTTMETKKEPIHESQPNIAEKPRVNRKKETEPRTLQAPVPYGDLALRCRDLSSEISGFVHERTEKQPLDANGRDFAFWFMENDAVFRARFYDRVKKLQADLAANNISDWKLDELVKRHENFFAARNKKAAQFVIDNFIFYHLDIGNIEEIGKRFQFLEVRVPHS